MGTLGRTTRNGKKAAKARVKAPPRGAAQGRKLLGAMQETEAVEQNKAITDILQVISRSPADLQPVFDTILLHAARLCDGSIAVLWRYDAVHLHFAAHRGVSPKGASQLRKNPLALGNYNPTPQAALERRTVHVLDVFAERKYRPLVPRDSLGIRPNAGTVLAVPLLRGDELLGVLSVYRIKKRSFTPKQIEMVTTFAAQAAIAIHNVRLMNETKQALEQQTTTAGILRVIASSPTDLKPVMVAVVESAARLADADHALIGQTEGGNIRWLAAHGCALPSAASTPISRGLPSGRAMLDLQTTQVEDVAKIAGEFPTVERAYRELGVRSIIATPLIREGSAVGVLLLRRTEVRRFTDKQVELLKTFADQAVIAIENARLFNETKEALDRQTATGEILASISSSITETQPVFDAIVRNLLRLLGTRFAVVQLIRNGQIELVAVQGEPGFERIAEGYPVPLDDNTLSGKAIVTGQVQQVSPIIGNPAAPPTTVKHARSFGGYEAAICAPMIREGKVIGALSTARRDAIPFDEKQVALIKSFADQAVIAIENARLFNETKEALDRQTATSEVLGVISSSATDTQPVFDAIVRSGLKLFPDAAVAVVLPDGQQVRSAAVANLDPAAGAAWKARFPFPLTREYMHGIALLDRRLVDIPDAAANSDASLAPGIKNFLASGYRAITIMPMLRGGAAIGAISVLRLKSGPLTDKQIALLKTFADQAVIAIENARLFNETKESLEQQTAISEILRVISSSPADVKPVLDAVAERAMRICESSDARIFLVDGDKLRYTAGLGDVSFGEIGMTRPLDRGLVVGRAVLDRVPLHIEDVTAVASEFPISMLAHRQFGHRTILAVPLMREQRALGAILLRRMEVRPFTEKQISLLRTFADQAAIAIENVRLFNETKESLERQTATAEILQVIGSSPTDTQPVFDSIVNSGVRLFPGAMITVARPDGGTVRAAAIAHEDTTMVAGWRERFTTPLSRDRLHAAAILDAKLIDFPDAEAEKDGPLGPGVRNFLLSGNRAVTIMPMLRGEGAIGAISVTRAVPGPLSDKQIAILRTFADQAVIAIENVRLFKELEARNKDLGESLEQQTSTAEVLKTISRSTFDLQTVLQALVDNAARLSGATRAVMHRPDADGNYRPTIMFNYEPDSPLIARLREHPIRPGRDSINGRVLLERKPIHVADVLADTEYGRQDLAKAGGFRTILSVPMLRDGEAIGLISLTKGAKVDPFTGKQMELVTTFADQAVIAIENVRLFKEIEEKSAQLEVANQHKSEFLANMSHELRTPLNAIIGFSEVLIERMFGEVNEKQADYLKDIHESGKHLLSLINDILDLSKIEAGRMELDLTSFDMPAAIGNAMTLVRERAQRHGIALGLDVDKRLGEFEADERKVKQILLNLLSNAVKFTPDGGRVDVSASMNGKNVEIAVRDTGIGIAPEDQASLFEEFKQVGRDYTRKAEGTGLGLALTKRFVELHGGEIKVESAPGKGSTFTVYLPVR